MKTKQRKSRSRSVTLLALLVLTAFGSYAQNNVLDSYVKEALSNNEGLKQQQFQLERSYYALKEARSLFFPSAGVIASYTRSQGGRTISMPVGDLLNPVYATLNELTNSSNFPQIENAEMQLNPDDFYDVKMRAVLPLVNAEIYYNRKIRQELVTQQQAAVNVYKRELVKEVKTAYYQYLQSVKAVEIYDNAIDLLDQNIKVNQSLVKNGVRNSTAVSRAETEKQKTEAERNKAINNRENAKAYFNFLLNRPFTAGIITDPAAAGVNASLIAADTNAVAHREELVQLSTYNNVLGYSNKLTKSYLVPKLSVFGDAGSQGFDWKFDDKSRYYMVGVNLEWNLFASGKNYYKVKQSETEVKTGLSNLDNIEDKLQLQYITTYNAYTTAVANYNAAQSQLTTARKYYNDQSKAYKEGAILYIELLDAQNQLTAAELQASIAQFNILIAQAGIERCTASYNINN